MRTIELQGKTYQMHYTPLSAVLYERITGENALDIDQFTTGKIEPICSMGYALLLSSNGEKDTPDFVDMLNAIQDGEKLTEFITAVMGEIRDYFRPAKGDQEPSADAAPQASEDGEGEDSAPKNA